MGASLKLTPTCYTLLRPEETEIYRIKDFSKFILCTHKFPSNQGIP